MLRKIAVMFTAATVLALAMHHPLLLSDDCQGCSGTIADAWLGTAAANGVGNAQVAAVAAPIVIIVAI